MSKNLKVKTSGTQGAGMRALLGRIRAVEDHGGYKLGWPSDATTHSKPANPATGRPASEGGIPVATVALWNEFGVPGRIPERPFFRSGNRTFARQAVREIKRNVVDGTIDRAGTRRLAMFHTNLIQTSILQLKTPPNADLTKQWKGSDNPLIDTGLMRRSLTHELLTK